MNTLQGRFEAPEQLKKRMEEMERNGESSDDNADASRTDDEDEGNRTPSPVKQSAEHSIKGREELSIEKAIEESKEQDQEHQLMQSQKGL